MQGLSTCRLEVYTSRTSCFYLQRALLISGKNERLLPGTGFFCRNKVVSEIKPKSFMFGHVGLLLLLLLAPRLIMGHILTMLWLLVKPKDTMNAVVHQEAISTSSVSSVAFSVVISADYEPDLGDHIGMSSVSPPVRHTG